MTGTSLPIALDLHTSSPTERNHTCRVSWLVSWLSFGSVSQPTLYQSSWDRMYVITKIRPCNILHFFQQKNRKISLEKINENFNIYAQNINCVYKLEPPR